MLVCWTLSQLFRLCTLDWTEDSLQVTQRSRLELLGFGVVRVSIYAWNFLKRSLSKRPSLSPDDL